MIAKNRKGVTRVYLPNNRELLDYILQVHLPIIINIYLYYVYTVYICIYYTANANSRHQRFHNNNNIIIHFINSNNNNNNDSITYREHCSSPWRYII